MKIDQDQVQALNEFAAENGRRWKSLLRFAWETGNYGATSADTSALQRFRNAHGPSGLARYHAPAKTIVGHYDEQMRPVVRVSEVTR